MAYIGRCGFCQSTPLNFCSEDQNEDLQHDHKLAKEMKFQWKSHHIRAENQERAKQNVLNSLKTNSALVLMDWALKFRQLNYREKHSEWFGKRGINWHVSCVITRNAENNNLEIASFVHLFDSCAQDWFAVCAILEHLLGIIKENEASINQVLLRSDGSGCYHNNNRIAAVYDVGSRVGIKVMR